MYEITCSVCGRKDMVPFQPRGDRPVLCAEDFRKQREGRLAERPNGAPAPKEEKEETVSAEPEE